MSDFAASYLGRLRQHVGHDLLLCPGVQVVAARDDGRVLVQQRTDSGLWEFPAGSCEPGQSFRTAAEAELREEAGIAVPADQLIAFATFSDPVDHLIVYPNGDQVHAFALCFWVRVPDDRAAGDDGEASHHRWVDPADFPSPAHPPALHVLEMFVRYRETGEFQAH